MRRVVILIGNWSGVEGVEEDAIYGTEWVNVRVAPGLRLALKRDEYRYV